MDATETRTDEQLVADAITAREEADKAESPSRWREADDYAELARRGWSSRITAARCGTNRDTVQKFVRLVAEYPASNIVSRPHFSKAYRDKYAKTIGEHIVQSEENEWYTPQVYIDSARMVLGGIDLDPASSVEANRIVGATQFWTAADDGMQKLWSGRLWLNPPYGGLAAPFIERLTLEYGRGVTAAIALVNAHCTDTAWFQLLWDYSLCFTDHRIDFVAPEGRDKTASSTHGSVFAYLGEDVDAFSREFGQWGAIVRRV
jgi:hypothetical protein